MAVYRYLLCVYAIRATSGRRTVVYILQCILYLLFFIYILDINGETGRIEKLYRNRLEIGGNSTDAGTGDGISSLECGTTDVWLIGGKLPESFSQSKPAAKLSLLKPTDNVEHALAYYIILIQWHRSTYTMQSYRFMLR